MMSETVTAPAGPEVNGAAPPEQPCADCATGGEKILAVVAAVFGLFVLAMAADMFTGGGLSRVLAGARGDN
jgi:hypothetical protein